MFVGRFFCLLGLLIIERVMLGIGVSFQLLLVVGLIVFWFWKQVMSVCCVLLGVCRMMFLLFRLGNLLLFEVWQLLVVMMNCVVGLIGLLLYIRFLMWCVFLLVILLLLLQWEGCVMLILQVMLLRMLKLQVGKELFMSVCGLVLFGLICLNCLVVCFSYFCICVLVISIVCMVLGQMQRLVMFLMVSVFVGMLV